MWKNIARTVTPAVLAASLLPAAADARLAQPAPDRTYPVDLVIALDVSSSMSGLIQSARQRLWDVVNELSRAQPRPDLRVAVLSYGSPRYGAQSGFVRVDVPLTRDLDAVNEALFGFSTDGGDEYVARVIRRAADELAWSRDDGALRIMFVAGNEAATQDPLLAIDEVAAQARGAGIVINTLYCANGGGEPVAAGWRQVAQQAGGYYASIDQNASAVASMATPYDAQLRDLSARLNTTYVPYGAAGRERQRNQVRQDRNAATMSAPAAASRAVTKAGDAYRASEWDLVDALEAGADLEAVEPEQLSEEMREMTAGERQRHVQAKSAERAAIRGEIERLAEQRRDYIAREAAKQSTASVGLADALTTALRKAAERKGFRFE